MAEIVAALAGAFLFLAGVVVGSRLSKGQAPVPVPRVFKPPDKKQGEPEEQGWATRGRPFIEEAGED